MSKRDLRAMVSEDDPQWMRFWNLYPSRVSKKDARHAWTKLAPSPALVEMICTALAWQVPMWTKQGYGIPYPASYINGERWTDEQPGSRPKVAGPLQPLADDWIEKWGYCFHQPRCTDSEVCRAKRAADKAAARSLQAT